MPRRERPALPVLATEYFGYKDFTCHGLHKQSVVVNFCPVVMPVILYFIEFANTLLMCSIQMFCSMNEKMQSFIVKSSSGNLYVQRPMLTHTEIYMLFFFLSQTPIRLKHSIQSFAYFLSCRRKCQHVIFVKHFVYQLMLLSHLGVF